jgi:hypothetical protein
MTDCVCVYSLAEICTYGVCSGVPEILLIPACGLRRTYLGHAKLLVFLWNVFAILLIELLIDFVLRLFG